MNDVDIGPQYACGNFPRVGDLIEFGTRHTRLLVSQIYDDSGPFEMSCDGHRFGRESFSLMTLIARHGEPEKRKPFNGQ